MQNSLFSCNDGNEEIFSQKFFPIAEHHHPQETLVFRHFVIYHKWWIFKVSQTFLFYRTWCLACKHWAEWKNASSSRSTIIIIVILWKFILYWERRHDRGILLKIYSLKLNANLPRDFILLFLNIFLSEWENPEELLNLLESVILIKFINF